MYSESRASPVLARINPKNLFQTEADVRAIRGAGQPPTCLRAHRVETGAKPSEVAEDAEAEGDRDRPEVYLVEPLDGKVKGEVQGRCEFILAGKGAEARILPDVEPTFTAGGFSLGVRRGIAAR